MSLNKFLKDYCLEIIYIIIIVFSYIYISSSFRTYMTSVPHELIRLINRIPAENKNDQFWIITDTNTKTVKNILDTQNVLSIDSVVNIEKPEHFAHAFSLLKKKYNVPLYLIIHSQSQDFYNRFTSANLDFPFKKLYEYGTINESYTLYLYTPKD